MQIEVAGNGPNRLQRGSAFKLSVCSKQPEKRKFQKNTPSIIYPSSSAPAFAACGPCSSPVAAKKKRKTPGGCYCLLQHFRKSRNEKTKITTYYTSILTSSRILCLSGFTGKRLRWRPACLGFDESGCVLKVGCLMRIVDSIEGHLMTKLLRCGKKGKNVIRRRTVGKQSKI